MFIKVTRSGPRQYLQLVEAFRDERGVTRHRHVANLGRVDLLQGKLDALINGLCRVAGRAAPQAPVFERALEVGSTWALTALWQRLDLPRCLKGLTRADARLNLDALTRVMVFNRLCDPESKLGVLRWLEGVVVPGVDPATITHQRLLRAMDLLEANVEIILTRLAGLIRPLLDQDLNLVFYDLTNVRSHGETQLEADLRAYGLSKETGGIERQFALGLVQSGCGLPLDFEVFPGNIGEVGTLLPMLARTLKRFPIRRVMLVADRGLLSVDQVEALSQMPRPRGVDLSWILAVPARRYGEFMDPVVALADTLKAGEAAVVEADSGPHRLIVAHDPVRAAEQTRARRERIAEIEAEAQALTDKLDRQDQGETFRGRKATDQGALLRFVERVKDAGLSKILRADLVDGQFRWDLDETALKRQEAFDGKLILLSNDRELTPTQIVERYKRLADIERGFRVLKSDIEIAPVHHRLPERIRAHGLICFLALLLHRIMRPKLKDQSPTAALEKLKAIQLHQLKADGQILRGLTASNDDTRAIYRQLDLPLPDTAQL